MLQPANIAKSQEISDFINDHILPTFKSVATTPDELKYLCEPETKASIQRLFEKEEAVLIEYGMA